MTDTVPEPAPDPDAARLDQLRRDAEAYRAAHAAMPPVSRTELAIEIAEHPELAAQLLALRNIIGSSAEPLPVIHPPGHA